VVSDAPEDIESARTRQEGTGMIFAFLFPDSDRLLVRPRHALGRTCASSYMRFVVNVVFMLGDV
jgi:hypothetical protein